MSYSKQNFISKMTAIIVTCCAFSIILAFGLFYKNINHLLFVWGEVQKITVYTDSEITNTEIKKIATQIKNIKGISNSQFISQEEAIQEFKIQVAGYLNQYNKDINLSQIIPAYFEVYIHNLEDLDTTINLANEVASKIKNIEGVEEVSYGSFWVEKYTYIIRSIFSVTVFIGLILIISTAFVISNLIKAGIYQRSKEIEILEMIGATKAFIKKPFIIDGIKVSFCGFLLALGINFFSFIFLNSYFQKQISLMRMEKIFIYFGFVEIGLFMLSVIALGYLVTEFNLSRFKWNKR